MDRTHTDEALPKEVLKLLVLFAAFFENARTVVAEGAIVQLDLELANE